MARYYEKDIHELWELFSICPVNDDDKIEMEFLHFPIGTNRFDIWLWFEETFDISVVDEFFPWMKG